MSAVHGNHWAVRTANEITLTGHALVDGDTTAHDIAAVICVIRQPLEIIEHFADGKLWILEPVVQ